MTKPQELFGTLTHIENTHEMAENRERFLRISNSFLTFFSGLLTTSPAWNCRVKRWRSLKVSAVEICDSLGNLSTAHIFSSSFVLVVRWCYDTLTASRSIKTWKLSAWYSKSISSSPPKALCVCPRRYPMAFMDMFVIFLTLQILPTATNFDWEEVFMFSFA